MRIRRLCIAVFAVLVCLFPPVQQAAADTAVRMESGLLAKGDILWLGQIELDDGSGSYNGPIPWQVLDPTHAYDGTSERATLLSRYGLALIPYGATVDGWATTAIRRAMQTMADDRSIFSQGEYDLILPMTTSDAFALGDDRLYPLTEADVSASGYLTTRDERMTAAIMKHTEAVTYWLRYYVNPLTGVVNFAGDAQRLFVIGVQYRMRPAASIEIAGIALYASPGGKLGGDAGLAANGALPAGEYVLTLFDTARTFSAFYGEAPAALAAARAAGGGATVTSAGGKVSVSYSGATRGPNEYVSAMITGGDPSTDVLFYGRLRYIGDEGDESGTVVVNVPAGLKPGGAYVLRLFSEQYNGSGDGPSRLTDYISSFSDIRLAVTSARTVPGTGDGQTPLIWLGLAAISAAGLLWVALRVRRAGQ